MSIGEAIEARSGASAGNGLFAMRDMGPGEVVLRLDTGRIFEEHELASVDRTTRRKMFHMGGRWMLLDDGPDFVNHSCAPNCWWADDVTLVTRRAVAAGEEMTFDYGTSDTALFWRDSWRCLCGAPACRGYPTGRDCLDPAFRAEYAGHLPSWTEAFIARHGGRQRHVTGLVFAAVEVYRRLRGRRDDD